MLPINLKAPLIVMRRPLYDAFLAGTKTIEYRRHRAPFTRNTYYAGRTVRLAYNYNVHKFPSRLARVIAFDVMAAGQVAIDDLSPYYPNLDPLDEIALIRLDINDPEL